MSRVIRAIDMIPALVVLVLAGTPLAAEEQAVERSDPEAPEVASSPTTLPLLVKEGDASDEPDASAPQSPLLPAYEPPRRGSPRAKVGGGQRGASAAPTPLALAPDHLAETVEAQPSLFWYLDGLPAYGSQIVFTVIDDTSVEPLAEIELELPEQPGIHRIRLADYGVTLERDVEYEWSISLVVNRQQRSRDIVANGYIIRVSAPSDLAGRGRSPQVYADLGLWYDALAAISDEIDSGGTPGLMEERNSLLRSAGLEVATQ